MAFHKSNASFALVDELEQDDDMSRSCFFLDRGGRLEEKKISYSQNNSKQLQQNHQQKVKMTLQYIICMNRQGKVRLAKWYADYSVSLKVGRGRISSKTNTYEPE